MDDTRELPADASESHYVAPSHAAPSATVTVTVPAAPTPILYQRNPPVQTASVTPVGAVGDPDGQIVTEVPLGPNDLPIGTQLNGTLQQPISTKTTQAGSRFTATLTTEVTRNGVVLLPAGSIVFGRVTRIHGGRRISGPSAIRLQAESISLPDGTVFPSAPKSPTSTTTPTPTSTRKARSSATRIPARPPQPLASPPPRRLSLEPSLVAVSEPSSAWA